MLGNSWVAAQLTGYQEGLSSMELVSWSVGRLVSHGFRFLKVCGKIASADHEAADVFWWIGENDSGWRTKTEQICSAHEPGDTWQEKPVTSESKSAGSRSNGKGLLFCAFQHNIYRRELLVNGNSVNPRALKVLRVFPVICKPTRKLRLLHKHLKVTLFLLDQYLLICTF
jgi:hypothetical protein